MHRRRDARDAGRWALLGLLALGVGVTGCGDEFPTAVNGDLMPTAARTVEVTLPFGEFGSDFRVLGGFGSPAELGTAVAARSFQGELDSRVLARFERYPRVVSVRDEEGVTRPDSSLTFFGGTVVVRLDPETAVHDGPVTFSAGATQQRWNPRTVSWEMAVDSVGDREAWPDPGAGPVRFLDRSVWDPEDIEPPDDDENDDNDEPAVPDSVVFRVDSATVAAWGDTTDATRGVRIDVETEGTRIRIRDVSLRLDTRPSLNPDTTLVLTARSRDLTFVYDPFPVPPEGEIWIGGAPAWRTIFRMDLPESLDGPAELCALVECPFRLTPEVVNFADLRLRSRASPPAFQPTDTLLLDVRSVIAPERLPRSPLGSGVAGRFGRPLPPGIFGGEAGAEITVPITSFIRDLVRGETQAGEPARPTLALLSSFEPVAVQFGVFQGPGAPGEPVLRLILTLDEGMRLP